MGKVKSTIITVIVTLIVLTLLGFSVISCNLPGGIERYNSILSNIHLGSSFTGDAYTTVLPDGVITAEQYNYLPEVQTDDNKYKGSYVNIDPVNESGNYWVEKEVLEDYVKGSDIDDVTVQENALAEMQLVVESDAKVLSKRFSALGYSSYSVTVVEGIAMQVSVPSNFTYAAYNGNDTTSNSSDLSVASSAISYLTLGGELTLRNTDHTLCKSYWYEEYDSTGSIISVKDDVSDYIKSVSAYSSGGTYAVKIKIYSGMKDKFYNLTTLVANSEDTYIRFYIGTENVINLTCESAIESTSFYIEVGDYQTAKNYEALLNTAVSGDTLELTYSYTEVKSATAASGNLTALLVSIAVIVVLLGVMVYSVLRYKKLGLVLSLMIVSFALVLILALYFIETQLTVTGLFVAFMCLMFFVASNYWAYDAVKREISVGRTVQNAVKTGYKKTLAGILDLHILLFIVGALLTFIATGEAAACGTIIVICTIASYCLYWFGRFMWYVTMSPIKGEAQKRKFFGVEAKTFEEMEEEYERNGTYKKSSEEA